MPKIKSLLKAMSISIFLLCSMPFSAMVGSASALAPLSTVAESGCGSDGQGHWAVTTSIDFGCSGAQCSPPSGSSTSTPSSTSTTTNSQVANSYCSSPHNAIIDLTFAIIKFISDGVGLLIIMSLIIAGIQYTFSRGEPQAINSAMKRIQSSVTALIIFIFAYALLNFVIPNGVFGQ